MNIKEKIISKVNSIQDLALLEELLKAAELEHEIEQFQDLSAEEKEAIDEGIKDAEEASQADAILDRMVHGSHRIQLKGESLRKKK